MENLHKAAIAFLVIGPPCVALGAYLTWITRAARSWPTTPGRIVQRGIAEYGPASGSKARFEVAVAYTYTVEGKAYTGARARTGHVLRLEPDARRAADQVPDAVTVHYDPADPSNALLELDSLWLVLLPAALGVAFLALGAVFLALEE